MKYSKYSLLFGVLLLIIASISVWSYSTSYGINVISDTPVYLALASSMVASDDYSAGAYFDECRHDSRSTPLLFSQILLHKLRGAAPDMTAVYFSLLGFGLLSAMFCYTSFFVFVRGLYGSRVALYAAIFLLFLSGPYLIIWSGDLSFHGLLYSSFYPQIFAFGLVFLILHFLYKESLLISYLLSLMLVIIHPLTFFFIALVQTPSLFELLRRRFSRLKSWLAIYSWVGSLLLLSLVWIFSSPLETLQSNFTYLVLLFLGMAVLQVGVQLFRNKLPANIQWQNALNVSLLLSVVVSAGLLLSLRIVLPTDMYISFKVEYWSLIFLPLLPAFILSLNIREEKRDLLTKLPALFFSGIFLFSLIFDIIPLRWRFLLFGVPFLCIVLSASVTKRQLLILCVLLVVVSAVKFDFLVEHEASYMNRLPAGIRIAQTLPIADSAVLTDPYTGWFLAGFTSNSVSAVAIDHTGSVCDRLISSQGFEEYYRVVYEEEQPKAKYDYILINKYLLYENSSYDYYHDAALNFVDTPTEREIMTSVLNDLQVKYKLVNQTRDFALYSMP